MVKIEQESRCCGCGACAQSCPVGCITMVEGTLGALFPRVDQKQCVDCGACERVCPMNDAIDTHVSEQRAYAAYSRDQAVRHRGSSGGMFETFSRYLLSQGYKVFGASFSEDLVLRCTSASTEEELLPLLKSKYLQSNMTEQYANIRRLLSSGEKIFFVGTPCQVAALKRYLGRDYDTLLLADFFCHGVPSQKFFDECRKYEEKRLRGTLVGYEFRTKVKKGATPHYVTVSYERNGRKHRRIGYYYDSPFYALFQQYITLRESCYACPFASRERVSDLTIGDFHEIDRYVQGINRFDGVSTVITNTSRGRRLFEDVRSSLCVHEVDVEGLIADGVVFAGATPRPSKRDAFVADHRSYTTEALIQKYVPRKRYIKQRIYYRLPQAMRKLLKKHFT